MSTPATMQTTPDAYGERSSQGVMSNLAEAVRAEMIVRRERLQRGFDDGIAAMKADYEMKVAQFTAEHADKQARLDQYETGINNFEAEATKATDAFLGALSSARVAAAELVPVAAARIIPQIEEVSHDDPPKFLLHDNKRRPPRRFTDVTHYVFLAIAATAMIAAAGVGLRL